MSEPAVTSFHLDTSAGGIPITLCACGLLIVANGEAMRVIERAVRA